MEQSKRLSLSPRTGTILGIIVIILAVIATLLSGPHEKEHDSLFSGEPAASPVATNLLSQQTIKQQLEYRGITVNFTQTALATKFSDDQKTTGGTGKYTLRVMVNTQNHNTGETIGVDYARLIQLILQNGQKISPKLVSIDAVEYPGRKQSGFVDFWVNQPISLKGLQLQFAERTIPLN